ncbi:hypothetical protein PRZ48_013153 [Zasmidium cellare]|uniref:Uncharacterized protein n=1 Tax=Zasmidium cellare TaxID=395010 RepID=A0ABR0E3B0_ZASCE|nr:hypothetical protein PRZ48_013153 [Zasmidium cellare]
MQFLVLAFAALAAAGPAIKLRAPISLCPALDTPLCCQLDVDGVLDATCESPSGDPSSKSDFEADCASTGKTAECCTLPLDGDALLCTAP